MTTLALTGGTGFVGGRLIGLALAAGHRIRALTRRPQNAREGVTWVPGSLSTPDALEELATGADALIHVAGVVNARDRDGFMRGNAAGTQAMLDAAARAEVARFVHVSSLAAREPGLSDYGWSKAGAERAVTDSDRAWTIVRPPAIYGPGDMEMRDIFRLARYGLALLPPPGRMSLIEVGDLARLLLTLATHDPGRVILEVDDGAERGWTHGDFARAVGDAVGRRVLPLPLPRAILSLASRGDALLRGEKAKLTSDRVSYFCHPDWCIDPEKRPDPTLWRPEVPTPEGLARTAAWYRAQGLL
ncbi:NAD-dependent epimerase/dehydratase family protein [Stakelama saccharophila]|uniref:NAD(P)-dependent oxidoreductase n=1 Tax=Stakelama saccharophila TaxID=3075605 RepID=A0ABZ0BCG8_9SPHN|nr:NAD(P)-dependent oxidoreductase [Stakelama sp. W311]WNO54930.1 NAD(P)-dependent oxidoreductase [Stakelama sp. W311]